MIMIGRVKEKPKDADKKKRLERGEVPKRKDLGVIRKTMQCPELHKKNLLANGNTFHIFTKEQ